MTTKKSRRKKSSAAATKEQLLDALLEMLAERSVAGLSVREIAREAGVNHGLVHRYFGSKEELVRQAVARLSARAHSAQAERRGLSAASFDAFRDDPLVPLVVARACLDGPHDLLALAAPPPERLEQLVAPLRAQLARLGLTGAVDPYLINALGTAALLGWFVFRPLLAAGYRLPPNADDKLAALLARLDALLSAAPA